MFNQPIQLKHLVMVTALVIVALYAPRLVEYTKNFQRAEVKAETAYTRSERQPYRYSGVGISRGVQGGATFRNYDYGAGKGLDLTTKKANKKRWEKEEISVAYEYRTRW